MRGCGKVWEECVCACRRGSGIPPSPKVGGPFSGERSSGLAKVGVGNARGEASATCACPPSLEQFLSAEHRAPRPQRVPTRSFRVRGEEKRGSSASFRIPGSAILGTRALNLSLSARFFPSPTPTPSERREVPGGHLATGRVAVDKSASALGSAGGCPLRAATGWAVGA